MIWLIKYFNIIFVALIPAMLCFIVAKHKKRNSKKWLLYGFIFNIYALLYLVFYLKPEDQDELPARVFILLIILIIISLSGLLFDPVGGFLR